MVQGDGYPLYWRQNNGQTFEIPIQINGAAASFLFNNWWIVLYNPYLTCKYKAHINLEVCASIHVVKYIYKYIYKGSDRKILQIAPSRMKFKDIYTIVILGQLKLYGDYLNLRCMKSYQQLNTLQYILQVNN